MPSWPKNRRPFPANCWQAGIEPPSTGEFSRHGKRSRQWADHGPRSVACGSPPGAGTLAGSPAGRCSACAWASMARASKSPRCTLGAGLPQPGKLKATRAIAVKIARLDLLGSCIACSASWPPAVRPMLFEQPDCGVCPPGITGGAVRLAACFKVSPSVPPFRERGDGERCGSQDVSGSMSQNLSQVSPPHPDRLRSPPSPTVGRGCEVGLETRSKSHLVAHSLERISKPQESFQTPSRSPLSRDGQGARGRF